MSSSRSEDISQVDMLWRKPNWGVGRMLKHVAWNCDLSIWDERSFLILFTIKHILLAFTCLFPSPLLSYRYAEIIVWIKKIILMTISNSNNEFNKQYTSSYVNVLHALAIFLISKFCCMFKYKSFRKNLGKNIWNYLGIMCTFCNFSSGDSRISSGSTPTNMRVLLPRCVRTWIHWTNQKPGKGTRYLHDKGIILSQGSL